MAPPAPAKESSLATWADVSQQFLLDRSHVQMALMLFASHPRPVREAIDRHRRALDENPVTYLEEHFKLDAVAREAAAAYVGGKPEEIALTGNTTTGLALLYGALPLRPGQEILTTTHDHYVTFESLRFRAKRTGAKVKRVALYATPEKATEAEIVGNLVKAVGPRTRIVAVTWVHSSTGVKLPIRAMADALRAINEKRAVPDRALLCVDGVHAFGVESESVEQLGCDFLVAGCHKWLFGPRGTGIVWGRTEAWQGAMGLIPCFEWPALEAWMHGKDPDTAVPGGPRLSPGGFQVYEHRWALPEAFAFHQKIGKERITARIHELATRCKEGLAAIPGVTLRTPMSPALSAGINCFEIAGKPPKEIVEKLLARKVVASSSPYLVSYARLTPGILNTPEEVDRALAEVKAVAAG
ncbi:MAG TPA: aminotransferase class V-fold PLP-dependent enzyme [Polyangia bacterium]|nr:aminotransferase class V-fold PLP-dependent enzyme [Polyangia bacterium]